MSKTKRMNRFAAYLYAHRRAVGVSLERLKQNPMTSFMTLIVITIALTLPTGLYLVIDNLNAASKTWDQGTHINLVLSQDINERNADQLINRLKGNPDIREVKYISPEQGLRDLAQETDTQEVFEDTQDNPLPAMIVVTPKLSIAANQHVIKLRERLLQLPFVVDATLDNEWVKKLDNLLLLLKKSLIGLSIIFGAGVVLTVGNAIQLASQRYHKQVSLYHQVGATPRYIRRPFLYTGVFFGLAASFLSIICITAFVFWLAPEVNHLENLYQHHFHIRGLDLKTSSIIVLFSLILAYLGAFVAILSETGKRER